METVDNLLNTFFNGTKNGIFRIGESLIILPEPSSACRILFGKDIENVSIIDLLFNTTEHNCTESNQSIKTEITVAREALEFCFLKEEAFPAAHKILPGIIFINNKSISIKYHSPHTDHCGFKSMFIEAIDVTEYEQIKKRYKSESARNNIIFKIALDKHGFFTFVQDLNRILLETKLIVEGPKIERDTLVSVMRTIHTIKGNASFFSLCEVAESAHLMEDYIIDIIDSALIFQFSVVKELNDKLDNIFSALHLSLEMISDFISREEIMTNHSVYQISEYDLETILDTIEDNITGDEKLAVINIITELKLQPVKMTLRRLKQNAMIIAAHMRKKVSPVFSISLNFPPDMNYLKTLVDSFTHIIKNSLDHGIEYPDERVKNGKPETGILKIEIRDTFINGMLHYIFVFSDDGRGIDTKKLKQAAIASRRYKQEEIDSFSIERLNELIFTEGLTTKTTANHISGRGVGMAATLKTVEQFSGEIKVKSQPGKGTEITIIIPYEC